MLHGLKQATAQRPGAGAIGPRSLEDALAAATGYPVPRPLGRHYFSDGAGEQTGGGEGDGTQTEGQQGAGQQAAGADAPAQSGQQQQAMQDADFVRVARRNFARLAPDGDFNKVIHLANEYQQLQQDGFGDLVQMARQEGLSGYQLIEALSTPAEQRTEAQQQQVQDATKQVQQEAAAVGQTLTRQEAQQMIREALKAQRDDLLGTIADQQSTSRAQSEEKLALEDALGGLGINAKPVKVTWGGRVSEENIPARIARAALLQRCQEVHAAKISPRDPQYERKLAAAFSRDTVQEAVQDIGPYLKELLARAGEEAAAQTSESGPAIDTGQPARLPPATLAGGRGGRAQQHAEDMTLEQRRAEAQRRGDARLQARKAGRPG